ncbi:MAG: type I 3-dehydroquinate dehydratase, partial [Hadesarchaea archaeon]|nr:type I 3-dehydroquinate dehydratase [Hadesarchaea archaeon]
WKELLPEGTPVIITNRAEREGGHFEGTESERIEILLNAINQGVACVDIELSTPQKQINKILNAAKDTDTSVITSFHDFEDIPPIEELIETAQRMEELEGSIGKIIGFTKNFRNGMKILDFLLRVPEEVDIPIISFAMGKAGRYTRIMSALFGSPIVYAAVEEKTAPGQFDVKTTRSLLEVIK